jgi:hypothetical protein
LSDIRSSIKDLLAMGEGIPIGGGFHSDVESSENEEDKTTQVEIKSNLYDNNNQFDNKYQFYNKNQLDNNRN